MTEAIDNNFTGDIVHVNPNDLMLELNVRTEAGVTKQFVESIRENGILTPITAVRDENGVIHVRAGQRRTLAAREIGLATVPVYIIDADADTATRIVQQMTENDHRLSMTATDRVNGIQQLLDTGMTPARVAKKLSVSAQRVKDSKAVAGSATAMEALHEKTATLEEAAAIAEFDGDEDAVERLLRAASRNYFDQELEQLRRRREDEKARRIAAIAYGKLGYTVLDEYPGVSSTYVPLQQLLMYNPSNPGELVQADESVVREPGQWAVVLHEESVFTDAEGNRIDETLIDWATEDDSEAEPTEGKLHASVVTESTEWVPSNYYCIDAEAAGLAVSERYSKTAAAAAQLGDGEVLETADDLDRKAADKAERKRVIMMNKAGEAAETVRRDFLSNLLKRKTPPEGTALFLTQCLIADGTLLGQHRGIEVADELLGASTRSGELLDHATDNRAQVILLGMALGALESATPKSAWRSPSDHNVRLLRFLATNGYGLSPIEQVMVGDMSIEDCAEELA